MARILLDLHNPAFQSEWFALDRETAAALLSSLRELRSLEWNELYRDAGFRWQAVVSKAGPGGRRIYTLRITRGVRAVAYRDEDFLRFLSLHRDHDSAYE